MSFVVSANKPGAGRTATVILKNLWTSTNLTDRLFLCWYSVLGLALLAYSHRADSWPEILTLHGIVAAAIVLVAWNSTGSRWWRFAHDWYPMFLFIAAFEEVARLSLAFIPSWQDLWILRLESALFLVPPTTWLNRWHNSFGIELLEFGYFSFYWIMPVVGGVLYAHIWNARTSDEAGDPRQPFRVWMDATVLGYIVCFAFYLLCPTEGPAYTLSPPANGSLPVGPFRWLVLFIQHHGGVHGNAFPSAHVMAYTVALVAALHWKPRLGLWLAIPALLLCVGAVYDGYHYLTDVVAGALVGVATFWTVSAIRSTDHAFVA